ncbi:hypothetical protein FQZ97_1136220 [compost metagenome]
MEEQLNRLILAMGRWAVQRLVEHEEQARLAVERRRRRECALAQQALQDAERQRLRKLERDAWAWQRAARVRAYLAAFEQQARNGVGMSAEQQQYLAWAQAKADWLDPLVEAADPLLDLLIEVPPREPGEW